MSLRRWWIAGAVALALGGVVAGCGGDDESEAPASGTPAGGTAWAGSAKTAKAVEALYDAAVKAGHDEVVIYGPYAELYRPIWEDFAERFPKVRITAKVLPGAATMAAVKSEVKSGRQVGDVIMQGLEGVTVPADEGLLEPYEPPTIAKLPKEYRDPQNRYVVQFGDVFGTIYNSAKMSEEDLPKTLQDLTDPKYKGFVIDDPGLGAVTAFSLMPIYHGDKLDLDFMKGLKANAQVVENTTPYYNRLVTGQVTMMPWASHQRYLRLKESGAPVSFDAVPGMSSLILGGTGIIKGAPHMKAAQLFQAWFLTPEAQNLVVSKGLSVALMPGTKYPADWPDYQALYDAEPQVAPNDFHDVRTEFLQFIKPVFP